MNYANCIVPALPGDTTAFHGICDRNRLMGVNLPSFEANVYEFMQIHADGVRSMRGQDSRYSVEMMKRGFDDMIDNRLLQYADLKMPDFANPSEFWNTVKSLSGD